MPEMRPPEARRRFLTAQWRHLVMLNYELDPALLRPHVPRGVELDAFHGTTFVSVVGFQFLGTRVLGIPVPLHRDFEEVNLRFYVRRETRGEMRRGVVFLREFVPRPLIAAVARAWYNEPYLAVPMRGAVASRGKGREASYEWRVGGRWNVATLLTRGPSARVEGGSAEEFITEHYWGYTAQRDGGTVEYRVEHPRWSVWQAERASLDCDVSASYGDAFAELLTAAPSSAFLADGSAVTVYRPERL